MGVKYMPCNNHETYVAFITKQLRFNWMIILVQFYSKIVKVHFQNQ